MRGRIACSFALVALLSASALAFADDKSAPPDLTGDWRFDAKHSDKPTRFGGGPPGGGSAGRGWGGERGGGGAGGMRGGHHGMGGGRGQMGNRDDGGKAPDGAAAGARPPRLPDLMHITQTETIVSFEDSSGAVLREVATVGAAADTFAHAPGAQHISGEWKSGKLVVERPGMGDSRVVETISLKEDGKTLEIDTKFEASGDMPAREMKRIYTKVATS